MPIRPTLAAIALVVASSPLVVLAQGEPCATWNAEVAALAKIRDQGVPRERAGDTRLDQSGSQIVREDQALRSRLKAGFHYDELTPFVYDEPALTSDTLQTYFWFVCNRGGFGKYRTAFLNVRVHLSPKIAACQASFLNTARNPDQLLACVRKEVWSAMNAAGAQ